MSGRPASPNSPELREWYVISCIILGQVSMGIVLSYPSTLTRALMNENSTDITATRDETSWIASAYPMSGPISFIMIQALMQLYGRRFIHILLNLCILIGNVVIATAPNVPALISGRVIQGLAFSSLYIATILVAEYSHPKKRGFLIALKTAASGFGILICHGLSSTVTWRQMAYLATLPTTLSTVGTYYFPESPSWLAYKGRFKESLESFVLLRGTNYEARKEIAELIKAQNIRLNSPLKTDRIWKTLMSKEFLKPLSIETILSILNQACGRYYIMSYLIEIMVQLSGDASKAFYFTIGFDIINIFGIFISTLIVVTIRRRLLLFTAGSMACFILALVCIMHYLNAIGLIELQWLAPMLLISFSFINHAGVMPLIFVLKGEIVPLEFKGLNTSISGVIYSLVAMVTLKLTSSMLVVLGIHGTLAVYVAIAALCLLYLYLALPETKDRTLQDIETEFITRKSTCFIDNVERELKQLQLDDGEK